MDSAAFSNKMMHAPSVEEAEEALTKQQRIMQCAACHRKTEAEPTVLQGILRSGLVGKVVPRLTTAAVT